MSASGSGRNCSTPPGRAQRRGIPGYTGFVPARKSEDVFGVTLAEANSLAREHRSWRTGSRSVGSSRAVYSSAADRGLDGTMDGGSINAVGGMAGEVGPRATVTSMFSNPAGTSRRRAGGAMPGYGGFIAGKATGSVIGLSFAQASIAAAEVCRLKDPPHWPPVPMSGMTDPPWQRNAMERTRREGLGAPPITPGAKGLAPPKTSADHNTWTLWEPMDSIHRTTY
mmetsp:Transcript_20808/g.37915  ORF Transcript_20808/g.37915 Transcript_20808/m.37915 type:complete len:225 (-) Transcript_20808:48-722(-)